MTDPTNFPPDSQEFQYLKSLGLLQTPAPALAASKARLDAAEAEQRRAKLLAEEKERWGLA
jgi:hypothetical protein